MTSSNLVFGQIITARRFCLTAAVVTCTFLLHTGHAAHADDVSERAGGLILANLVIKSFSCASIQSPDNRAKYAEDYLRRVSEISDKVLKKVDYASNSPTVSAQFKSAFVYGATKLAEDPVAGAAITIEGKDETFDCGNPAHLAEYESWYAQLENLGISASE